MQLWMILISSMKVKLRDRHNLSLVPVDSSKAWPGLGVSARNKKAAGRIVTFATLSYLYTKGAKYEALEEDSITPKTQSVCDVVDYCTGRRVGSDNSGGNTGFANECSTEQLLRLLM